jgi:aminoglycoside phosphotransferase (APT) family kinase protein
VRSRTRRALDDATIDRLVGESFGPGARVSSWTELTDGTFNAACRIAVEGDGGARDVVVKIAPHPDTPLLTYERDLLRTEALFTTLAARHTSVPVPALIHGGFERRALDSDYVVVAALSGRSLSAAQRDLPPSHRRRLRTELGGHLAALHRITGDAFGYPQAPAGLRGDTWREAFGAMVAAVLDDAQRFRVELPLPAESIHRIVDDSSGALDAVRTPVLTHFDLWDGNVFITGEGDGDGDGDGGPRIEGLIDAERAFWGDPHADLASLALLRDLDEDDPLLTGYREAGGRLELDGSLWRRLHLYRAYLDLVMLVEAVPRGYDPVAHAPVRRLCEAHLSRVLRALADEPEPV